jgi:tetraacyldisaccharide-1-P 4'-kinase
VIERIAEELARYAPDRPILRAAVEADGLVGPDERRTSPDDLRGQPVIAACGIGNPETFRRLVASLAEVRKTLTFPDHRRYTLRDVERIQAAACEAKVERVVTTRKDWGKLAPLWPVEGPSLARLDVRVRLQGAVEQLDARLHQALEERR